jgi:hypothetical protein
MFEHIYQDGFISSSFLSYAPIHVPGQQSIVRYLAELTADIDVHLCRNAPEETLLLKQLEQLSQLLEDMPSFAIDNLLVEVNDQLTSFNTRLVRVDNEVWLARKTQPDGDLYFVASLKTIVCLN